MAAPQESAHETRSSLVAQRVWGHYTWDVASALPVILQDSDGNTYVYGWDLISRTDGAGNQEYYLYDGLGSTIDLVDGSGNSVTSYGYDVFGAIRTQTGSSPNYWLFTGEQRDGESDLYYLRARDYDPREVLGLSNPVNPTPGLQAEGITRRSEP